MTGEPEGGKASPTKKVQTSTINIAATFDVPRLQINPLRFLHPPVTEVGLAVRRTAPLEKSPQIYYITRESLRLMNQAKWISDGIFSTS